MLSTLRDPASFARLLDEMGISTRRLADTLRARGVSVSHQRIGQLRTGSHLNIDPQIATRIEYVLCVQPGTLFDRNTPGA